MQVSAPQRRSGAVNRLCSLRFLVREVVWGRSVGLFRLCLRSDLGSTGQLIPLFWALSTRNVRKTSTKRTRTALRALRPAAPPSMFRAGSWTNQGAYALLRSPVERGGAPGNAHLRPLPPGSLVWGEYVAVAHRLPPGRVTGHLQMKSRSFPLRTKLKRARPTRSAKRGLANPPR